MRGVAIFTLYFCARTPIFQGDIRFGPSFVASESAIVSVVSLYWMSDRHVSKINKLIDIETVAHIPQAFNFERQSV